MKHDPLTQLPLEPLPKLLLLRANQGIFHPVWVHFSVEQGSKVFF